MQLKIGKFCESKTKENNNNNNNNNSNNNNNNNKNNNNNSNNKRYFASTNFWECTFCEISLGFISENTHGIH